MILPRLLGILNYHTQKSCVFHLTNYVRSQENTAATEPFNLSLFLFSSSRSSFRPLQLVSEKPAPFHFSVKLWLEPFLASSQQSLQLPLRTATLTWQGSAPRQQQWGTGQHLGRPPPTPAQPGPTAQPTPVPPGGGRGQARGRRRAQASLRQA